MLGQAPACEQRAQSGLGGLRIDLTPEGSGGKSSSPGRRRWPRRRPSANRPECRRPRGSVPRHRSARSGGAYWPASTTFGAAATAAPAPARRRGTSASACWGWAGRCRDVGRRERPRSGRPPSRGAAAAGPVRPRAPDPSKRGPAAWAGDNRAGCCRGRGRGTVSSDVARFGERGRRPPRGWRSTRRVGRVGATSAARG